MGRPKGLPKTGGRIKGSPNKRSQEFLAILAKHSYNPLEALLSKYSDLSLDEQMKIDLKLLEFTYPKFKDGPDIDSNKSEQDISSLG